MKSYIPKLAMGLTLCTTNLLAIDNSNITKIDTLILYSQGAKNLYNDTQTRINHLITTTNKIYKDSGLDIELNPVKIQQYAMNDSISSANTVISLQSDANVARIRDEVGADEVIIYRPYSDDGYCGIAYQNDYLRDPSATWVEKYAFAHIVIDCASYTTAHEVGHNMGLAHSAKQNAQGAFAYARGHGEDNNFTTIMAYEASYNGDKLYKFSSPRLDCNGLPCGIEEAHTNEADAVKALRKTSPLVSNFREHIAYTVNEQPTIKLARDIVSDNITQRLTDTKQSYEEQKQVIKESKKQLQNLRDIYTQKKETYLLMRTDYKTVKSEYSQARREYKNRTISKDDLLTVRARLIKAKTELITYKNDTLTVALTTLKDYYKNNYKTQIKKLEVLEIAYLELESQSR